MLGYAIIAIGLIIIAAAMYLGYNWDKTQTHIAESNDAQRAAFADIQEAKLQNEGKLVGPDEYEPDFFPALIAVVLVALCAMAGLPYCTVFFTLCFAAICIQIADVLKAKLVVDWVQTNSNPATA